MAWSALPNPLAVAIGDDESGHAIAVDGAAGGAAAFLVVNDDTGAAAEYPATALTFDVGGDAYDAGDEPDELGTGTDDPAGDEPATGDEPVEKATGKGKSG